MRGLTIAQKAIKGSHMYKCNITYRYGFILRWNPRIYNMCRQALAHEQENLNNFLCSVIFGDWCYDFLVIVTMPTTVPTARAMQYPNMVHIIRPSFL